MQQQTQPQHRRHSCPCSCQAVKRWSRNDPPLEETRGHQGPHPRSLASSCSPGVVFKQGISSPCGTCSQWFTGLPAVAATHLAAEAAASSRNSNGSSSSRISSTSNNGRSSISRSAARQRGTQEDSVSAAAAA
ncbi:hypothetical protein Emed_001847 [Eimeria media]